MTTRSQDSFFTLSAEAEDNYSYPSMQDEPADQFSQGSAAEGKEKARRRRGCGHPYRMRLNMSDDEHRPNQASPVESRKPSDFNKPVREKQGRHPYRRGAKMDNRNKFGHHKAKFVQQADDQSFAVKKDDTPRLGSSSQQEGYQVHSDVRPDLPSHHDANEQRRPRNLFPYHQRARKKRHNDEGFQGQRDHSQQKSWQPAYDQQNHEGNHGQRKPRQYANNYRRDRHDAGNQLNYPQRAERSQESVRSYGSYTSTTSEGAKVFYKKRRQTFSPSSSSAGKADDHSDNR